MSSAPNILQPLTLNSSNGLLETIFPVDHTPSPLSPYAASEQENFGDAANCRRRLALQTRPFSELYSEEFVPLDDVTSPELSRSSHLTNNENALNGNDTTAEVDNRTSSSLANSVDIESPDETIIIDQGRDSQNVLDDTDGSPRQDAAATLTQPQGAEENDQNLENQPMEIPEESDNVDTSEAEMGLSGAGQRTSVGSIELTEDSPLRILEESERVREERIALSNENLLEDNTDDELEEMDITDDTIVTERDSSHNSDYSMEDVLTSGNGTRSALNESNSIDTQPMADRQTDLLEAATNALLDEDINDLSLQELEESRALPAVLECSPGTSVDTALIETEAGEITSAEGTFQLQSENSEHDSPSSITEPTVEYQENSEQDVPMSLLEYVDQIITTEQSSDNAMMIDTGDNTGDSTQVGTSWTSVGTSERAEPASVVDPSVASESGLALSSVTLPMEESEPVCLDATSLRSASTSEMLVDTPGSDFTVNNRVGDDGSASPQRPPQGKRLSRSSSDPRSAHSRRRVERSRNAARGSNQGENSNSPMLSRPPLIRRVTEPTTNVVNPAVVPVNTGVSSQVVTPVTDPTADLEVSSPTESVVMAVPLSPLPLCTSSPGAALTVVVADGVAETAALVTPLPSPDSGSERTNSTSDNQSTIVAVSSDGSRRAEVESPTSPNDYLLILSSESRQPSSAPSTLQRGTASAVASQVHHRRNSSQDNSSSSVIYATPLSGLSREFPDHSASFPRQSSAARVTALSGNRRRSSSSGSGSGYTVSRAVPEESQSLPRNYSHTVSVSSSTAAVVTASTTLNSEQSRSERVNNDSPSLGATSLPGPSSGSGSDVNQSREAIQTMLRSYCLTSSTQVPPGRPPAFRPPKTPTTSAQEPEAARRTSRSGNRRNSGRRQQGNPIHVSIQDQQQSREQQARPEQQTTEEEPLPSSKTFETCFRIT